jgi:chemotaxis protein CheD
MTLPSLPGRRLNIVQGEFAVSDKTNFVITTLLGSCVAVCMHDPAARVGGMNHFLLPGDGAGGNSASARLGVHLMELLINGLLKLGASRDRLQAKLFGGARTVSNLGDFGAQNVAFAQSFLEREGIILLPGSTGGNLGRKLQFEPSSGRAFQNFMADMRPTQPAAPLLRMAAAGGGDVELFDA